MGNGRLGAFGAGIVYVEEVGSRSSTTVRLSFTCQRCGSDKRWFREN